MAVRRGSSKEKMNTVQRPLQYDKISQAAQVGGIETSVLDNGPGRGTRIAWVNTGSGLRFKVVVDRAMDIAEAFYGPYSLAWLSETGVRPPQPFADKGIDWLRTFGGGLMVTCGLSHVGGPETDEFGTRGLHGEISNCPAELVSIEQPDPANGCMKMSLTGIVRETRVFGARLALKRTIMATVGEASIRIHDEVTNRGNTDVPHMLLYHFNFGWPLADEGARILWNGEWVVRDEASKAVFNERHDFHQCPAIRDDHAGMGEAAAFIDLRSDDQGMCHCGLYNPDLSLAASLHYAKEQLPWMTNWQHWGHREYITGLEPGTHKVIGQAAARKEGTLIFLAPGESRTYDLVLKVHEGDQAKAWSETLDS